MAIIPLETVDRGEILTAACSHSADTNRGGPGGQSGPGSLMPMPSPEPTAESGSGW